MINPQTQTASFCLYIYPLFLSHSNCPINTTVPDHNNDDAVTITAPMTTPSLSPPQQQCQYCYHPNNNAVTISVPAPSLNMATMMLSSQSLNLNTTLIIWDHVKAISFQQQAWQDNKARVVDNRSPRLMAKPLQRMGVKLGKDRWDMRWV